MFIGGGGGYLNTRERERERRERERESRETGRVVKRYNDIRRERIERKSG